MPHRNRRHHSRGHPQRPRFATSLSQGSEAQQLPGSALTNLATGAEPLTSKGQRGSNPRSSVGEPQREQHSG
ncbi:uncharacterized protein VTP21DRAFT_8343 [Calcarisporiella thermophila]|uniref:uncharacterized protein n=1 Tax=Calcarisporiella thermophila TaxID=911321 RepID=UPI003742BE19